MFTTPTKPKPSSLREKSKEYYVYRGGTDYSQSSNYQKYKIAFFAEKISLARVYNEVTENKLNPSYKYYRYELNIPYTDKMFLQEKDFIKEIQLYGITGENSPYKYNSNTGVYTRVSSSSSADYEFFNIVKNIHTNAIGVWSGGEVVIFDTSIVSTPTMVEYEDSLDETPLFKPVIRGKKLKL